jgi:hypothetical protein
MMSFRPTGMSMCATAPPSDWRWQVTSEAAVGQLVQAMKLPPAEQAPAVCQQ